MTITRIAAGLAAVLLLLTSSAPHFAAARTLLDRSQVGPVQDLFDALGFSAENATTIDCGRIKLPHGGNPQMALDCTYNNGFPRVLAVDEAIFNQVPSSISLLTGLTQIVITRTRFVGGFPTALANMSQVIKLTIDNCEFTDPASLPQTLTGLKSILSLQVTMSDLGGFIPNNVGWLTTLTKLDFSHNNLRGAIPNSFVNLVKLQQLLLTDNLMGGNLPAFLESSQPLSIYAIDLYDNFFIGDVMGACGGGINAAYGSNCFSVNTSSCNIAYQRTDEECSAFYNKRAGRNPGSGKKNPAPQRPKPVKKLRPPPAVSKLPSKGSTAGKTTPSAKKTKPQPSPKKVIAAPKKSTNKIPVKTADTATIEAMQKGFRLTSEGQS